MYGFGMICSLDELIALIRGLLAEDRRPLYAEDIPWEMSDEDEDEEEWDEDEDEWDEDEEDKAKGHDIDGCPYSCPYVDEMCKNYCPAKMFDDDNACIMNLI